MYKIYPYIIIISLEGKTTTLITIFNLFILLTPYFQSIYEESNGYITIFY